MGSVRVSGQDDPRHQPPAGLEGAAGGAPGPLDELRTGQWLDAQTFDPLRYAVPRIVPEGLTLHVGAPKVGKSWIVLAYALAVAAGGRTLGVVPVERRPVLMLALEDGDRRMQDRCRKLLEGAAIPAGFDYLTRIGAGYGLLDTVGAWLARHRGQCPLVIVDTLGKVMPPSSPGESAYQRDYRVGTALKRLADDDPGTSLLVNHHDRKAQAEDFVDAVSGTHGLAGAADTIVVVQRARHDEAGLLHVTGRDVQEASYAVRFAVEAGSWRLDGSDLDEAARNAEQRRVTAGLGDRTGDVLAYVAEHPNGVTVSDVEQALDEPNARRYLSRLADSDRLRRVRRGVYAPVGTHGTPHLSKVHPLRPPAGR